MTFFLYLPLLIAALLYYLFPGKAAEKKKDMTFARQAIILFALNILSVAIARVLFKDAEIAKSPLGQLALADFRELPNNFWNNIVAIFMQTVGTQGNIKVLSREGVDVFIKACVLAGSIWAFIRKRAELYGSFTFRFFALYLLIVLTVTSATSFGTGAQYYYFLIPCFEVYLLSAYLADRSAELPEDRKMKIGLTVIVSLMIASNGVTYYGEEIRNDSIDESTVGIVNWLEERDIHNIYAPFWLSGPIEAYSNGDIRVGYLTANGNARDLVRFEFLNKKGDYTTENGEAIVILSDDIEAKMLENADSKISKARQWRGAKIYETGTLNVYEYEIDHIGGFKLPSQGESKSYIPTMWTMINADLTEDGTAISNGAEGFIMAGPYIHVDDGVYDMEVDYRVISSEQPEAGRIDIASDLGTNIMAEAPIILSDGADQGTAELHNVEIDQKDNVEFRAYAYADSVIEITEVRISRIG